MSDNTMATLGDLTPESQVLVGHQDVTGFVEKVGGKGLSSNDYTDAEKAKLDGVEPGAQANVRADWEESDSDSMSFVRNKPSIPAPQVQADWEESDSDSMSFIRNKPDLSSLGVQADWEESDSDSMSFIKGKPTLFSGSYDDLTGKPTLFSGSYDDLTNKPTIPAAQVRADWNETDTGSMAFIQNKPTIPEVRYALVSPQPSNGVVTLQDRAVNRVQVQVMEDYAWTWSDGNDHGEPYFVTGDGEWVIGSPDLIVESISPSGDGTATSLTVTCDDIREYTITNAVPAGGDEAYSMTFTPVSGGEPVSEVMVTLGDEVELTIAGWSYYSMGPVMGTSGTVRFQGYPVFTVTKSPVYVSDVSSVQPPASVQGRSRDFLLRLSIAAGASAPTLSFTGCTFEPAAPSLADGSLVWFKEVEAGKFLVIEPKKFLTQHQDISGKADASALRYSLVSVTPTVASGAAEATLNDRAVNAVDLSGEQSAVTSIAFTAPAAVDGKARDFIVRVTLPAQSDAPQWSINATLENADGELPALATDASVAATTLLYFTETAAGVFLVKGEEAKAVA